MDLFSAAVTAFIIESYKTLQPGITWRSTYSLRMSQLIEGVLALLHLASLGLIFFIRPVGTPLTTISIVILVVCVIVYLLRPFVGGLSLFDTKYVPWDMGMRVCRMFRLLTHMSEPSSQSR